MAELTEGQRQLAIGLQEARAVRIREEGQPGFKLKIHQSQPDAPLSPIFLNLRTPEVTTHGEGTLTPEIMQQAGTEMYELVDRLGIQFDHVAGIPNAGVPFSRAFGEAGEARGVTVSQLVLHKEGEGDSRHITREVDGDFQPGDTVLVIDDLVTHAGTKMEAITALREAGLRVVDIVVLVDREQGGPEELARHDVATHAVFTLSQMLDVYLEQGSITPEIYQEIRNYLQA